MAEEIKTIIEDVLKKTNKGDWPAQSHELVYDSSSETLEPVYFWVLDMANSLFGGKVEKLVDNFTSSPGSGHFAEFGQRKSIMQKNVTESMGTINTVLKSIINLIYDLKDFEIRLGHYDAVKSENKEEKEAGLLALKQIWMDNVDIKRGRGSINMMAQDLNFVTLRDGFMYANSIKDIDEMDLNDRVKRVLKPRLDEFLYWKDSSEAELRKRFAIEKNYLRSQVNSLQLYSRWVKPYLKSASELEMEEQGRNPELVKTFNTILLQLTLIGKDEFDVKEATRTAELPTELKIPKRKYYSVVLIDFRFRGIPIKQGQHFLLGGKATVNFNAYALNEEELKILEQNLKKSDVEDALKLIEGATTESLDELKKDLDHYLEDDKEANEEEKKKKKSEDTNPFSALFGSLFKKKEEKDKKEEKEIELKKIKKDNYAERLVRALAAADAANKCFTIYDVYKKAHGMASHDNPFE